MRSILRKKNGKDHESFSIVENKRVAGGKVVQRHVLYLGEINSTQQEAWRRTIEIFEDGEVKPKTVALFPEDRAPAISNDEIVRIRLKDLQLKRARQWGACWLATELYQKLQREKIIVSLREGRIRVSPHLFNSERDIDCLISVVRA